MVRGDTFVVKANIHYPTESSLIRDGVRKIIETAVLLAALIGARGWRQHQHLFKNVKKLARQCDRVANKKGPGYQERLKGHYRDLLKGAEAILERASDLEADARRGRGANETSVSGRQNSPLLPAHRAGVRYGATPYAEGRGCAQQREAVQHLRAGDAIVQARQGRRAGAVWAPGAGGGRRGGFHLPLQGSRRGRAGARDRGAGDAGSAEARLAGKSRLLPSIAGFILPRTKRSWRKIFAHPCVPTTGSRKSQRQEETATVEFRAARQRHPGIESAIGALQSGNGLKRCRDHSYVGFRRYVGLGVLGRNLHVLGKLLLQQDDPHCEAAYSERKRVA